MDKFYLGHGFYSLCYYNPELKVDLPLVHRVVAANRHDSVSALLALSDHLDVNPDLPLENLCLDAAHDNYATYELCDHLGINSFIDLSAKAGRQKTIPDKITTDDDGTPTCAAEKRMVSGGYNKQKHAVKWRCPLAARKSGESLDSCPCRSECSPSSYGRVVYTKAAWDLRLYTPVPCGTAAYTEIYKQRTSCERVNKRQLVDYRLHKRGIGTRVPLSFYAMINGINMHLDARLKLKKLQQADCR